MPSYYFRDDCPCVVDPNVLTLPKPKTWRLARKIDAAMHRRIEEASIAPTGSATFLSLVIGTACRRAQCN